MLNAITIGSDTAIKIDDDRVLIASKSKPGQWYELNRDDKCECPGFKWRHRCRHIDVAALLLADPDRACVICGLSTGDLDENHACGPCARAFGGN